MALHPHKTPQPATMRYARPGERPPSKFAPGVNDQVIDRFDAFAKRRFGKK